jgi:hypothetical protein
MADLLSQDEIDEIRDAIAPSTGDELVSVMEVWRMPEVATPPSGGAGVNSSGFAVEESTDVTRPDLTRVKVAEYPARISRAGTGKEDEFGGQVVSLNQYSLFFNWGDAPDIEGGDRLLEKRAVWQASHAYALGDVVQPTVSNGRCYVATDDGTSAGTEAAWPLNKGDVVTDGGVEWTCTGSLKTYEVVDSGTDTTYKITRNVRAEVVG